MSADPAKIQIQLNGEPVQVPSETTILALVESRGRHPRTVAIEYNGDILKREAYATTDLKSGDRVEVVHFVQGGC